MRPNSPGMAEKKRKRSHCNLGLLSLLAVGKSQGEGRSPTTIYNASPRFQMAWEKENWKSVVRGFDKPLPWPVQGEGKRRGKEELSHLPFERKEEGECHQQRVIMVGGPSPPIPPRDSGEESSATYPKRGGRRNLEEAFKRGDSSK